MTIRLLLFLLVVFILSALGASAADPGQEYIGIAKKYIDKTANAEDTIRNLKVFIEKYKDNPRAQYDCLKAKVFQAFCYENIGENRKAYDLYSIVLKSADAGDYLYRNAEISKYQIAFQFPNILSVAEAKDFERDCTQRLVKCAEQGDYKKSTDITQEFALYFMRKNNLIKAFELLDRQINSIDNLLKVEEDKQVIEQLCAAIYRCISQRIYGSILLYGSFVNTILSEKAEIDTPRYKMITLIELLPSAQWKESPATSILFRDVPLSQVQVIVMDDLNKLQEYSNRYRSYMPDEFLNFLDAFQFREDYIDALNAKLLLLEPNCNWSAEYAIVRLRSIAYASQNRFKDALGSWDKFIDRLTEFTAHEKYSKLDVNQRRSLKSLLRKSIEYRFLHSSIYYIQFIQAAKTANVPTKKDYTYLQANLSKLYIEGRTPVLPLPIAREIVNSKIYIEQNADKLIVQDITRWDYLVKTYPASVPDQIIQIVEKYSQE